MAVDRKKKKGQLLDTFHRETIIGLMQVDQ
jgi:hypothetical protein